MRLQDLPVDGVGLAGYQQTALMRLQLMVTGETHRMLNDLAGRLRSVLADAADEMGMLSMLRMPAVLEAVGTEWRRFLDGWSAMFAAARRQAAAMPFGVMARQHEYFMGVVEDSLTESAPIRFGVQGVPFFEKQLQDVLDVTEQRVYGDGFRLSQRLWRLDKDGLDGIQRVITEIIGTGDSAWNGAKKLERYLGMGADCPRWTSTRLRLTKKEIASGDRRGLKTGDECRSQGVAYNALRLARNEIQIAHHAATDAVFGRLPWVAQEQIHLSNQHPEPDVCDDVVGGGENGDGVYPKGEVVLPLHVQCLCFKSAVLMPPDVFARRVRGWMGGEPWDAMDEYAGWLGIQNRQEITSALDREQLSTLGEVLLVWLGNDWGVMGKALGL